MHKFGVIFSFLISISAFSAEPQAFSPACSGDGDLPRSKHADTWAPMEPEYNPSVVRRDPPDKSKIGTGRGAMMVWQNYRASERSRKEYILTPQGLREHIASLYVRFGISLQCPSTSPITVKLNKEIAEDLPQDRTAYEPFLNSVDLATLADQAVRESLGKMIEDNARGVQGNIVAGRTEADPSTHGGGRDKREVSNDRTGAVDKLVKGIAKKLEQVRDGKEITLTKDEALLLQILDSKDARKLLVAERLIGPVQTEYYRMLLRGDDAKERPKGDGSTEAEIAKAGGKPLDVKGGQIELKNEKDVERYLPQAMNSGAALMNPVTVNAQGNHEAMRNTALRTLANLKRNGAKDWKTYAAIEAAALKVLEAVDKPARGIDGPEVVSSNAAQDYLSYAERLANERQARDTGAKVLIDNNRSGKPMTMAQAAAQIEGEVQALSRAAAGATGGGLTPESRNKLFSLPPRYRKMLVDEVKKGKAGKNRDKLMKVVHNATLDNVIDYFTGKGKDYAPVLSVLDQQIKGRPHAGKNFNKLSSQEREQIVDWAGEQLARDGLRPDETAALSSVMTMAQEWGHHGDDLKGLRALRGGDLRYRPDALLKTHQEEKKARKEAPEISRPLVDRWRKELHDSGHALPRLSSLALYHLTDSQMKMLDYLEEEMKRNGFSKEFEQLLMTGSPELIEGMFYQRFPELYKQLLERGLITAVNFDTGGQRLAAEKGLLERLTSVAAGETPARDKEERAKELSDLIDLMATHAIADQFGMTPEQLLQTYADYKNLSEPDADEKAFIEEFPKQFEAIKEQVKDEAPRNIAVAAAQRVFEKDPTKAAKILAGAFPDDESLQKAMLREMRDALAFEERHGRDLGQYIVADEASTLPKEMTAGMQVVRDAAAKEAEELERLDREMRLRQNGEFLQKQRDQAWERENAAEAQKNYEKVKAEVEAAIRKGPPSGRGANPKAWRERLDAKLAQAKATAYSEEEAKKEMDALRARQETERSALNARVKEFAESTGEFQSGEHQLQALNYQAEINRLASEFVDQRMKITDPEQREAAIARVGESIAKFTQREAEIENAAVAVQRTGDTIASHRGHKGDLASDLFRSIEADMTSGSDGYKLGAGEAARLAIHADKEQIDARHKRDKEIATLMEQLKPMGARWTGNSLDLSEAKLWLLSEGIVPGKLNQGFTGRLTPQAAKMVQAMRDLKRFTGKDEYEALVNGVREDRLEYEEQNMFTLDVNNLAVASIDETGIAEEYRLKSEAYQQGKDHKLQSPEYLVVFHDRKKVTAEAQAALDRNMQLTPRFDENGRRINPKTEIEELLEQRGKYGHTFASIVDRTAVAKALGFTTVTDGKGNLILDDAQNRALNEYLTNIDLLHQSGALQIKYPGGNVGSADASLDEFKRTFKQYAESDTATTAKIHGQLDTTREIVIQGAIAAATMGTSAYLQSAMVAGRFANVAKGLKVISEGGKLSEAGLSRNAVIGTRIVQGLNRTTTAMKSGFHAAEGIVAAEMIGDGLSTAYQRAQLYRYKNDGFGGWLKPDKNAPLPSYVDRNADGKVDDSYGLISHTWADYVGLTKGVDEYLGAGVHAYRSFGIAALTPWTSPTNALNLKPLQVSSKFWQPVVNMQTAGEINNLYGHYTSDKSARQKDFWTAKEFALRQKNNAMTAMWMLPMNNLLGYVPNAKKQFLRDYTVFAGVNAAATAGEHFWEGGHTMVREDYTTDSVSEAIAYRLMNSFWMDAKAARGGFQHGGAKRRTTDAIMGKNPPKGPITQQEKQDYQIGTGMIPVQQKGLDRQTPGSRRAIKVLLESNGVEAKGKNIDGAWAKIQEARGGDRWARNKSIAEVVGEYARDVAKADRQKFYDINTRVGVLQEIDKITANRNPMEWAGFFGGMEVKNLKRHFGPVLETIATMPLPDAALGTQKNWAGFFRGGHLNAGPKYSQIKPEHREAFVGEFQTFRRANPDATLGDYLVAFKRKHRYEGYRKRDVVLPAWVVKAPANVRRAYEASLRGAQTIGESTINPFLIY